MELRVNYLDIWTIILHALLDKENLIYFKYLKNELELGRYTQGDLINF